MAARKAARKTTRKKAARKTTRKKTTRKKAARKKTTRKKTTRKKTTRKKSGALPELPRSLAEFRRNMRRDLAKVEKQIESAGRDARRTMTRLLRDASHHLGQLEARGEREWRKLSRRAKAETARIRKRVERATS